MSHNTKKEPGVTLKGVSRIVTGRKKEGRRVTYDWNGNARCTERVVLMRCRQAGYEAYRLPPAIWRSLGQADPLGRADARIAEILRSVIRPQPLQAIIHRHTSGPVDPALPGTPDLLVFRRGPDATPRAVRFVEVKRGGRRPERLKPHQLEELRYLKSLGFKAGVLRLEERFAGPAGRTR